MADIRTEILRLIKLNDAEHWVPTHIAVEQLQHFGDELTQGLVECLTDSDSEVRHLAVQLLAEAVPQSDSAVPALIERLTDEDPFVQAAVATYIAEIGPIASAAIPYLEPWFEYRDEFMRVLALTTIVRLDPNRTELLPQIEQALTSVNPTVGVVAQEFLDKSVLPISFDEVALQDAAMRQGCKSVRHDPCVQGNLRA